MKPAIKAAESWFRKADNDLTTVKNLIQLGGPYDTASFHTQQAAEKYLKGFLAFHRVLNIPKTHNLVALYQLCCSCNEALQLNAEILSELTAYAVDCRYDLEFFPDEDVVAEALSSAKQVRAVVLTTINNARQQEDGL